MRFNKFEWNVQTVKYKKKTKKVNFIFTSIEM